MQKPRTGSILSGMESEGAETCEKVIELMADRSRIRIFFIVFRFKNFWIIR
jgi:hypothetical protein